MVAGNRESCNSPQFVQKIVSKILQGRLNPTLGYTESKIKQIIQRGAFFGPSPFKKDQLFFPIFVRFKAANDDVGLYLGGERIDPG